MTKKKGFKLNEKAVMNYFLKKMAPQAITFLVLITIYSFINDAYGFERTLMVILVGMTITISTGLSELTKTIVSSSPRAKKEDDSKRAKDLFKLFKKGD